MNSGSMVAACRAVEQQIRDTFAGTANVVPDFGFGGDALNEQSSPPSLVWVPRTERIMPTAQQGADGRENPRSLWRRELTIEAHIWATGGDDQDTSKDFTACEDLANHAAAALQAVLPGAHRLTGGSWLTGQEAATRLGAWLVLEIVLLLPFTREPDASVIVTAIPVQAHDPINS